MNISFTTFSALLYRLTLLDQHNCHHFLVHIYSDRKSLYNVQINYCLWLSSQRFPLKRMWGRSWWPYHACVCVNSQSPPLRKAARFGFWKSRVSLNAWPWRLAWEVRRFSVLNISGWRWIFLTFQTKDIIVIYKDALGNLEISHLVQWSLLVAMETPCDPVIIT